MVSMASFAGHEPIYQQVGFLRLERYANDALEVLQLTGTMDTIINYLKQSYLENAENLAVTELRKILPSEIQFRLIIGDENSPRLDNIFPTPGKHAEWIATFQKEKEMVKAVRAAILPPKEKLKILAWVDNDDENFVSQLLISASVDIKSVNNIASFWNEVDAAIVNWQPGHPYYDTIFIPDAEVDLAPNGMASKIADLIIYQKRDGRVVVGGSTLYHNCQLTTADGYFWESLGIQWGTPPPEISGPPLDNMCIINSENFVTLPYSKGDNIEYNQNYTQYVYTPRDTSWVVAQWEDTPDGVAAPPSGIIVRPAGYNHSWAGLLPKPAVLFNMRFAQSATDADNSMGTADWITLIKRAIGYEEVLETISLYVWRGPPV